jgi:ATP-binding cassette subfamily C protein
MSEATVVPDAKAGPGPEQAAPAPGVPEAVRAMDALFAYAGGRPAAVARGNPLDLADPGRAWAVIEGKLDAFLVAPPDASGISRRAFLMRVPAGEALFGLSTLGERPAQDGAPEAGAPARDARFGIDLAAGWSIEGIPVPGTRCVEARVADLLVSAGGERLDTLVGCAERWVTLLCAAMRQRKFPGSFERLQAGTTRTFQESNRVVVAQGVGWITVKQGGVRVNGLDDAAVGEGQTIALSEDAWLECAQATVLACEGTREAVAAGRFVDGLSRLQERFVARAVIAGEMDRAANKRRIERKQEDSRTAINAALRRLNQVIEPRLETETFGAGADPLLAALLPIGAACGIAFRPRRIPREDGADAPAPEAMSAAGSLESYVRDANARHREVALRGRWWEVDNGPLLGFLEGGRAPVALLPRRNGGYVLHDPASGSESAVGEEVAATLAPMAHAFYRGFGDGPVGLVSLMRFGSAGLSREVAMVILIGLLVGALGLLTPYVTGLLFDSVIPGAGRSQLAELAMILVGAGFATAMFEVARAFTMLRIEGRMDSNVQAAVWDRLLRLPVPFFRGFGAGDLALRANGINAIRQHLSGSTVHTILTSVFSVFNFFLLFYYSSKLAWVAVALVAVQILLTTAFGLLRVNYERRIAELGGRLASVVLEFLTGVSKLRTTGAESRAFGRWAERHSDHEKQLMKARRVGNLLTTVNAVYPLLSTGVIFFFVSYFSKDEKVFSTGEYLAFNTAFGAFMGAMVGLTGTMMSLLVIVPIWDRAKPILRSLPESSGKVADPGIITGDVEVSGVTFKYAEDAPTVLSNVSLRINPGEFVAFVGPSGSGKSTLLRLLLGFEKPLQGSVFYDGQDLASLDVGAVRRQIGVVLQNGQLLAGDIFSNIVGSSGLGIEDAREAAKACGLDADIDRMPMGMHTLLPDGGGTLSGGQRQRLLIARAIVTRPRVLLFDEATSALDNRNQAIVTASLERLKATRIVIAHRLSTVIGADRIFVLAGGRLVQQGTFRELMAQDGPFRELASRQMV